jgi:hypothetical protein
LFLHAKNNLAPPPQGLAFRPERVVWEAEPVAITANETLAADAARTGSRTAKAEAMGQCWQAGRHPPLKSIAWRGNTG